MMQTMTCQDFNRHTNKAQTLADREPVLITKRGKPAYILQSYQSAQAQKQPETLAEWFSQANPEIADVDWELSPHSTAQRAELDWSDE